MRHQSVNRLARWSVLRLNRSARIDPLLVGILLDVYDCNVGIDLDPQFLHRYPYRTEGFFFHADYLVESLNNR